jgi:hypothetical protein
MQLADTWPACVLPGPRCGTVASRASRNHSVAKTESCRHVQGGGDMGAIPNKLTGFQDVETDLAARGRFEAVYGALPSW